MALPDLGAGRGVAGRIEQTVRLLERRGYALPPARLGDLCLEGPLTPEQVVRAVSASPSLTLRGDLVLTQEQAPRAPGIAARAASHREQAPPYLAMTRRFVRRFVQANPYVLGVAIAGSLASGGFAAADDVDLNLIVEDGRRHLAYVALNAFGLAHALLHRGKPVDALSRRPVAPRLMTANLILERSQCFPLARQDADMAYEILVGQPVHGAALWRQVVDANPGLTDHFPQLDATIWEDEGPVGPSAPAWLFPRAADRPARALGRAAWRWMQWTRRREPEALARVAYVRQTMRPYTLFDEPSA